MLPRGFSRLAPPLVNSIEIACAMPGWVGAVLWPDRFTAARPAKRPVSFSGGGGEAGGVVVGRVSVIRGRGG